MASLCDLLPHFASVIQNTLPMTKRRRITWKIDSQNKILARRRETEIRCAACFHFKWASFRAEGTNEGQASFHSENAAVSFAMYQILRRWKLKYDLTASFHRPNSCSERSGQFPWLMCNLCALEKKRTIQTENFATLMQTVKSFEMKIPIITIARKKRVISYSERIRHSKRHSRLAIRDEKMSLTLFD